jgi:hypothetical protein
MKQHLTLRDEECRVRVDCLEDESLSDSATLGRLIADLLDKASCPRPMKALADAVDTLSAYHENKEVDEVEIAFRRAAENVITLYKDIDKENEREANRDVANP